MTLTFSSALRAGAMAAACTLGPAAFAATLTDAQAVALVDPIYRALSAKQAAEIAPLLEAATSPDWLDCSGEGQCQDRPTTLARWTGRLTVLPDYRWERKQIYVTGPDAGSAATSHIVVRGEATGTPAKPFLGIAPNGRAFRIMTLDVHDVRDGKIVRTFHVEDWGSAMRQLSAP